MSCRRLSVRIALAAALLPGLFACGGGGDEGGGNVPPAGTGGTGSATVSWLPPTENVDGSAVVDLAGYHIYRGTRADRLSIVSTVSSPGITSIVLDGLARGTHYFAVSAYLSSGAESERSPVESKNVQ